ncbi:olfactory receptor 5AP2-like [Alligator mississippiensis]|uniref:olfactory receptor 5AP2-like n=1 Tax=Alligator mississippiensis TaxID=8496 RepID=UPI000711A715|nr:olfactory receptor 5AP2-like [Alligator mississippiensis]
MANTEWRNQTIITEFILLGFGNLPILRIPLFLLFLLIYIVTMAGNLLIIMLVVADHHLHTPMYFFLGNLSCLETCYSATILPKMLSGLLNNNKTISFLGCFLQFYIFGSLLCTECILLSIMSYDRYLAICDPLHYTNAMNPRICAKLASSSWITGPLVLTISVSLMSTLTFCGPNEVDHFFCDLTPLLQLSCTDTHLVHLAISAFSSLATFPPFLLTIVSYGCIIATILRIQSTTGRQKTFSTCSSHLIVVTVFFGTLISVYLTPTVDTWKALNKVLSVFYTVLTPMVNPLIYSLRNREVMKALSRALSQ